eukprot:g2883.t1
MRAVRSGDETEIRLRPIDMEGHAMTATITTQPGSGKLYQLSHVYNQYGYEPKKGAQIQTSPSQTVTGSNFRLLYAPPAKPVAESFYYTATDSEGTCNTGKVTMLESDLRLVGSDFAGGVDGWTVHNNLGNVAPTHEMSTQGKMSWYVTGTEADINVDGNGHDSSLWYFNAPAKFLGHKALAYGGTLVFSLAAFSGFQGQGGTAAKPSALGRHLVVLHCSSCNDRRGITLGWKAADTEYLKTADFSASFSLPLLPTGTNVQWEKDPQNSNHAWTTPSQDDMVEVLSNLTYLRILGDFTDYYESVGLDDVYFVAGASAQPIPYTSRSKAEIAAGTALA